jgi:hypothetical protein
MDNNKFNNQNTQKPGTPNANTRPDANKDKTGGYQKPQAGNLQGGKPMGGSQGGSQINKPLDKNKR